MRITVPIAKVLAALLTDPAAARYGLDLMNDTGISSSTLYPVLQRLTDAGWLSSDWETIDAAAMGRPARRYYRLTADGVREARHALAELRTDISPSLRVSRVKPA